MSRRPGSRPIAFLLASVVSGCGTPAAVIEPVDCTDVVVPTYHEMTEALAFCTKCHGAVLHEAGVRFDTYEYAKRNADDGVARIASGSMPAYDGMPAELADAFIAWAECGMPE